MMISWHVNPLEKSFPLLDALASRLPSAPRAFLRQLYKKKRITLNGQSADPNHIVQAGDHLEIKPSARLLECVAQSRISPQQILFEDRCCVVLYKPAGLIVHPAHGQDDNLLARLETFMRLRGEPYRLAPIHRLDRCTSGPVMFGKGKTAARELGQLFMDSRVQKHYLAMVDGMTPESGSLSSPVPAHGKDKESLTHFRTVACRDATALLDLRLETGRRHQIRRQLAEAGWPLTGDARYGHNAKKPGLPLLHCYRLQFPLLSPGEEVTITSSLSSEQLTLLEDYGISATEFFFTEKTAPFDLLQV